MLPLAFMVSGCIMPEMDERLNDLEERLDKLETQVSQLNDQVSLISQLLSGKYFIQSVSDLEDGSGYRLVLVDGNGVTVEKIVHNGADGADGAAGSSPQVSVAQDTDGNYYWTLNGSWLLVGGQKVRANGLDGADGADGTPGKDGADGLTPKFKLEGDKWYVKLGDGEWTYVGEAAKLISGPIASIDYTSKEGVVIITLSNNTVLEVPKASSAVKLQILLADESVFQTMQGGETRETAYEVVAPVGVSYSLDSYKPQGWTVTYTPPVQHKGTLSITLPAATQPGDVLLIAQALDGSQQFVKVLHVGQSSGAVTPEEPVVIDDTVDAGEGSLDLPAGATNISIPQEAASWVSFVGGKLQIAANTEYSSRTVVVSFMVGDKEYALTITQAQKDAILITSNALVAKPEGEVLPLVVQANVEVEAQTDASWITVEPATKALEDKPYTITVAANDSGSAREAVITFSYKEISQEVTVSQEAATVVPPVDDSYILVTDADDLQDGDQLLIVNKAGTYAMAQQVVGNSRYRSIVAVSVADDVIEEVPEEAAVVTLESDGDLWHLAVTGGYLVSMSSGNNLNTESSASSANASWSISVDADGNAVLVAQAGASTQLSYNGSAQRFSCYRTTSPSATTVCLYRKPTVPATPVTQYTLPGIYMGSKTWEYVAGQNQYCRSYNGNALTFVLLDPETQSQLEIEGYSADKTVGSELSVSVNWRKGSAQVLSKTYSMQVLQEEGKTVWIGDSRGNGFILKK